MIFLEVDNSGISKLMLLGTLGMLILAVGIIVFVIFHQRKIIRYQMQMKRLEADKEYLIKDESVRRARAAQERRHLNLQK